MIRLTFLYLSHLISFQNVGPLDSSWSLAFVFNYFIFLCRKRTLLRNSAFLSFSPSVDRQWHYEPFNNCAHKQLLYAKTAKTHVDKFCQIVMVKFYQWLSIFSLLAHDYQLLTYIVLHDSHSDKCYRLQPTLSFLQSNDLGFSVILNNTQRRLKGHWERL